MMQAYTVNSNGDVVIIENFVDIITVETVSREVFSTSAESNIVDASYGVTNVSLIEKIDDLLIGGGFRVVTTKAEMEALPPTHRKVGMRVSVLEDNTTYVLTGGTSNTNWLGYPENIGGSAYSIDAATSSTVEVMRVPLASFYSFIAVVTIISSNVPVETYQCFVQSDSTNVFYNRTNIIGSQDFVTVDFTSDGTDMVVQVTNTDAVNRYLTNLRYV